MKRWKWAVLYFAVMIAATVWQMYSELFFLWRAAVAVSVQNDGPLIFNLENKMNRLFCGIVVVSLMIGLTACNDADIASNNLSKAADNFEINRRIVFYNGITDSYMLTIEGLCSLGNHDATGTVTVTCKTGPNEYKKNFLGLSDNVTFFAEQLEPAKVDVYHYRVFFKPAAIIPDVDLKP